MPDIKPACCGIRRCSVLGLDSLISFVLTMELFLCVLPKMFNLLDSDITESHRFAIPTSSYGFLWFFQYEGCRKFIRFNLNIPLMLYFYNALVALLYQEQLVCCLVGGDICIQSPFVFIIVQSFQ